MKILLFLFFILIQYIVVAQFNISGLVTDQKNEPIIGATVSTHVNSVPIGTTTNLNGGFSLKGLPKGDYVLLISFMGLNSFTDTVEVKNNVKLKTVVLTEKEELLKSLKVKGTQAIAIQKGDTTEYNASAFKTNIDATSGDLLDKIPGVSNDDGKLTADGEEVKKILIDGKPFFGSDTKAAMETIPADGVAKIQILDDKTEKAKETGVNDGKKEKTINIVTKESFRNSIFGDILAGYGMGNVYTVGGNANVFNSKRKVSIFGFSNNINKQGGTSLSSINSGWNSPTSGLNSLIGWGNQGVFSYNASGVNWVEMRDKGEINFSYSYLNQQKQFEKSVIRNYTIDTGYSYNQNQNETNNQNGHSLELSIKHKMNDKFSLRFSTEGNLSNGLSTNVSASNNVIDTLSTASSSIGKSVFNNYSIDNNLGFTYKLDTNNRSLNVNFSSENSSNSMNSNNLNSIIGTSDSNVFNQLTNGNRGREEYGASISYNNPLKGIGSMNIGHRISNSSLFNDNNIGLTEVDRIDSLSNISKTRSFKNESFVYFTISEIKGLYVDIGLTYERINFDNTQTLPSNKKLNRTFNNFVPNLWGRYKFNKRTTLSGGYFPSVNQPTAQVLQTNIDNSNLLNPTIGNPDLKQSYNHYLYQALNISNKDKTSTLRISISGSYDYNDISRISDVLVSDTVVNGYKINNGTILNTYSNLNNYSFSGGLNYSFAWSKIKSKFSVGSRYSYSENKTIILGLNSSTINQSITLRTKLTSNISEKIDFTIRFNPKYSVASSTTNNLFNRVYVSYPIRAKFSFDAPKDFVFKLNYNGNINTGYVNNINYHLLSFTIGKRLFKNKMGKIQLEVFDALEQNNNLNFTTQPGYIEETRSNILQRYFMLSFTYKIRAKTKKPKNEFPEGIFIMEG